MLKYDATFRRIPTIPLRMRQRIHHIVSHRRVCFLVRLDLFNSRIGRLLLHKYRYRKVALGKVHTAAFGKAAKKLRLSQAQAKELVKKLRLGFSPEEKDVDD